MSTSRRAQPRRRSGSSAVIAAAALVVTLVPAVALSSASAAASSTAASSTAAASGVSPAAAGAGSAWTATSTRPQASLGGRVRQVDPSSFGAYTLDEEAFAESLAGAPAAGSAAAEAGDGVTVRVPAPNGTLVEFNVVQSAVLAPELAARHPEIRAYVGTAVDHADSISIQLTPTGAHVAVRGATPSWFIDPAYQGDDSLYLSYLGASLPAPERAFVEPELDDATVEAIAGGEQVGQQIGEGPDGLVKKRTYRLALLTDPSYAEFVAPDKNTGATEAASDSAVLAAKTVLISRVNEVYGDDLGVELQLVAQTDQLNLNRDAEANQPGGPCGADRCFETTGGANAPIIANGCTSPLLARTRLVIGQLIGAVNFDVGHIGLGINGGGIASVGVVGGNNKAQGCTGLPFPTGDFYAIDYVAHEMGHQFAGSHTFNGTQANCSGSNRTAASSVEPGSGSSVMAYAGICQQDNLQPHSDPYLSQRSQTEMGNYINSALNDVNEVQSVAFSGFDGTDSFTLDFPGVGTTAPIVRGTNYSDVGIQAAIEAVFAAAGRPVTATVVGHFGGPFGDTGFQVTFSGTGAGVDQPNPTLTPVAGTFTSLVNDIAKGGAPTNGGATVTTGANHNPTVTAPAGSFIPMRTPFALTGSAADSDGDPLLYLWEQNDRGAAAGTGLVSNTKRNGPLFRVFGTYADVSTQEALMYNSPDANHADGNPTRVFPDLDQVLADNTNAETGTCPTAPPPPTSGVGTNVDVPVIECYAEFLPTADYVGDGAAGNTEPSLNFRLTARDNQGPQGGTSFADVKLRIDKSAGPFLATSQPTATSYDAGSTQTVTWAVNGTNKPSLAQDVRISFSSDGGQTFPTVLAASTPNDGSEPVRIPSVNTTQGRIKIEAVGNYFFDVTDGVVTVTVNDVTAPQTSITSGVSDEDYLFATSTTFGFASSEPGSSFTCTLDGASVPCGGSSVTLSDLTAGTHRFAVAATDVVGNVDTSPAARSFTVPVDDGALTVTKKNWSRSSASGAFLGTTSTAKRKGATLSTSVTGATRLALVVSTGKRLGAVKVKLNGTTLARVSLKGTRGTQQVVYVDTFAASSGTVEIVSASKKKVVVDGLVVVR